MDTKKIYKALVILVMAAALAEGYEIADLKLKPMALKNPTKKCGVYAVNIPALTEVLNTILL